MEKERLKIVIVGHVDHGKSTVIGRLLADTGSLPEGKLEAVKANCARNAKPFEYAFLLDALKDEQAQGITIDSARCFFESAKRHYIVIDAPGHIEFLKNMVTGAANAETAMIVIDAKEGVQENTRRHGYLLSMLGIRKVVVLVNKMDLVDFDQATFERTAKEYNEFLAQLNLTPVSFIPISAFEGDNIASKSPNLPWYKGLTVMEQLDALPKSTEEANLALPFRFPLQDIYKFTEGKDDRRTFAGTVETGSISIGEEVIFLPSEKRSRIRSIETFNTAKQTTAQAGQAIGFTLETQLYLQPGELMVKAEDELPNIGQRFRSNIFWMGKAPLIKGKSYLLKIGTKRVTVKLVKILNILDASELSSIENKEQVDRHDVGECIFETNKPIAFDLSAEIEFTGRFVIVDDYEIAGGGIILEAIASQESLLAGQVKEREEAWETGLVTANDRGIRFQHQSKFILITGEHGVNKREIAKNLEKQLFNKNYNAYYLSLSNLNLGLDRSIPRHVVEERAEQIRKVGELARIMTDAGQIFITTLAEADDYDLERLKLLNEPHEILVVNVGENRFSKYPVDLCLGLEESPEQAFEKIIDLLNSHSILEYYI
ncbi:MAG: adenylyl-sulfate kinase [SAR324 cluster bacterium]|uniref:sulfate adenylyltransferase n=1 Tax=SAR324 cluster bacterium TaxID=2024889 RepID=A0A2A4SYA7_9DELT|nr:MAG: adenylyl-sulfate kinase [SAR324 cluster bacterium]